MKLFFKVVCVILIAHLLSGNCTEYKIHAGNSVIDTAVDEEKVLCNATMEDAFADNRVMVVIALAGIVCFSKKRRIN